MTRSDYELQPAPEFLFERRPLRRGQQQGEIPRERAPILSITSDPHCSIAVVRGSAPNWQVFFSTEDGERTLTAERNTVSVRGPHLRDGRTTRSELLVEAPEDAGVIVHASYASVEVRGMAGPVWVAAAHARATILDTTGEVDATAGCVDYAGSGGRVTLSAQFEINIKITTDQFDGTLLASAQRCVRMLVPPAFSTPVEVAVGSRDDFVCRAAFRSDVKHHKLGELYTFTYDRRTETTSPPPLYLRSEQSTVVIDQLGRGGIP